MSELKNRINPVRRTKAMLVLVAAVGVFLGIVGMGRFTGYSAQAIAGPVPVEATFMALGAEGTDDAVTASTAMSSATLTATPAVAVPNMNLTISGSGFSTDNDSVICQENITIGGAAVVIDPDSRDSNPNDPDALCSVAGGSGSFVNVTSGGTFIVTVVVPVSPSLLDAGIGGQALEIRIVGSRGRSGSTVVRVPKRTLEVTPDVSSTRSLLTIRGSGFPADNSQGVPGFSSNVTVTYEHDGGAKTTSKTPDANGDFTVTMTAPTDAPIPSKNTIRAVVTLPPDQGGGTGGDTTAIHEIPGGAITVSPGEGPSGSSVRVKGFAFKPFTSVDSLEFGGLGTLGGRTVNTDEKGNWEVVNVLVPQLGFGTHSVIVRVGEVTANTAYTVVEGDPTRPAGEGSPVLEAVAPIGENLERAFHFNNRTKTWAFFDPRPEFAGANTITELISGQIYWLKVKADQLSVPLKGTPRDLTCVDGDCWNQIAW